VPTAQLSIGRRLLYSGIMLLMVVVFLELMLQAFYVVTVGDWLASRTDPPIFEEDETRCYRVKGDLEYHLRTNEFENTIYTNSQGMRTDSRRLDVSIEKPEGVYRILLLGPSFAFGWGSDFEETYATLIGELLRKTGLDVEVVNLGTPAQGPAAQLCWLQQEGYLFEPDMVLQTTYGVNITTVVGECPKSLSCPFIENSRIYSTNPTLRKKLIAHVKKLGTVFYGFYLYNALSARPVDGEAVEAGKELYLERARQSMEAGRAEFVEDYHSYRRLVQRVVGPHTEVVFLFLPVSYIVYPEDASRWSHINNPDPMGARRNVAAAAEALQAAGVELIDTTPALIARADSERLYYWLDIHLTPAGNRVVAQTAVPRLAQLIADSVE
jgi:hypothetical protein